MKPTNTPEFFDNLNAGVFSQQLGRALSDVAANVIEHNKKGKVIITLDIEQIGESHQVNIRHKLDYQMPTKRGSRREDTAQDTPMYLTKNGLDVFPRDPTLDLFPVEPARNPAHA